MVVAVAAPPIKSDVAFAYAFTCTGGAVAGVIVGKRWKAALCALAGALAGSIVLAAFVKESFVGGVIGAPLGAILGSIAGVIYLTLAERQDEMIDRLYPGLAGALSGFVIGAVAQFATSWWPRPIRLGYVTSGLQGTDWQLSGQRGSRASCPLAANDVHSPA